MLENEGVYHQFALKLKYLYLNPDWRYSFPNLYYMGNYAGTWLCRFGFRRVEASSESEKQLEAGHLPLGLQGWCWESLTDVITYWDWNCHAHDSRKPN